MLRDFWTKKIARMVRNIEAGKTPVPITALYVLGAYANGEIDPTELDIIVIHPEPTPELLAATQKNRTQAPRSFMTLLAGGMRQFESEMFKALRRPGERINISRGYELRQALPSKNDPYQAIHLVWSPTDRDWQGNIARIAVPAGYHSLAQPPAIQLPDSLAEDAYYLSQLIGSQEIQMTRIPLKDLPQLDMDQALEFLADPSLLDRWGVNTKPLFPYACAWLTTQNITKALACDGCIVFDHQFRFRIQVGKPYFRKMVKHFDRMELEKQCYIPFLKKGYAKEVCVFERGQAWTPTQEGS